MRTFQLLTTLLTAATTCTAVSAQNTYSLVASDFQFDPLVLTMNTGDTVRIALGAGHSFREVSQTTWDLNVGAPGIGYEFDQATELTVHELVPTTPGTIYYVCVPHVNMGMKGQIVVVQGTIGMAENKRRAYRIYPNPATGMVRLNEVPADAVSARLLDATGRVCAEVALTSNGQLDLRSLTPGTYHLVLLDQQGRALVNDMFVLQGF